MTIVLTMGGASGIEGPWDVVARASRVDLLSLWIWVKYPLKLGSSSKRIRPNLRWSGTDGIGVTRSMPPKV